MRNVFRILLMVAAIAVTAACSTDDDSLTENYFGNNEQNNSQSSTEQTVNNADLGELTKFDIAIDKTALSESETIPSDDEDYIENNDFGSTIKITYNGTSATVDGSVSGVEVTVTGADVVVNSTVKGVNYILTGTTSDGMFKIYSEKKFQLTLNGVSIANSDGPAINSQSGKRAYVVLTDGTENSLSDGSTYADAGDEDQKGTFFSEGELLFSGKGSLSVSGNTKAGIASDDYVLFRPGNNIYVKATSGNGIKANDGVVIKGGVINVEVSGTAKKGISCDGFVAISGGRTTLITTGNGEYDSSEMDVNGSSGLKADSTITISGGTLLCKSTGTGGKGISCDQDIVINDGVVKVITTGKTYTYGNVDSKPKGIKSDGNLTIKGGSITVRATGDSGSEGIESKSVLTIEGGSTEVYSYDDAINSASHMYIKGGYIFAYATNNDAIDANGNMYVQGGTTVAYGTTSPECGIDANEEGGYSVIVTGGTLIAMGGGTSYPSNQSTQPSLVYGGIIGNGTTLALYNGTTNILTATSQRAYNGTACVLITSPQLVKGGSYTLYSGATATGTDWYGLITGGSVSNAGNEAGSVSSLASPYSSIGSSVGGMGGGQLGGGNGGGGGRRF